MEPNFLGFSAEPTTDAPATLGGTRVMAWSDQRISTNAELRAWVGTQELGGVSIDQFGLTIDGWVENPPDPADTLFYQLNGGQKTDTGVTVDDDPPIV